MKTLLTYTFAFIMFSSFAATKTTVADGDWFDANNWNPIGVPLMEDIVIINHNISTNGVSVDFGANWLIINANGSLSSTTVFGLHGNLRVLGTVDIFWFAIGDGDSTIVNGNVYGERYMPGNPNNFNYGTILADTLVEGDTFDNYGLFDGKALISGADFRNHSGAAVITTGNCIIGMNATNEANATMVVGDLMTSDDITNDGDISCQNWTHSSGIASGIGSYCVAACFINNASISGTLDICDASPGGFCDLQMGTIAGTVTFCTVGPCANNVGIAEKDETLLIYPNPANSTLMLQVNDALIGKRCSVYNLSGRMVQQETLNNLETKMNVFDLTNGMYIVTIEGSGIRQKFIKN